MTKDEPKRDPTDSERAQAGVDALLDTIDALAGWSTPEEITRLVVKAKALFAAERERYAKLEAERDEWKQPGFVRALREKVAKLEAEISRLTAFRVTTDHNTKTGMEPK